MAHPIKGSFVAARSGDHWDDEYRYEGWGSGEWSELRYCERVVRHQQKHLQLLMDAGGDGRSGVVIFFTAKGLNLFLRCDL